MKKLINDVGHVLDESLDGFAAGTRIGTTSLRRAGQVLAQNPDVEIAMLRGNVETRLSRVREGRFDATLLAAAGQLGWLNPTLLDALADLAEPPLIGRVGQHVGALRVAPG